MHEELARRVAQLGARLEAIPGELVDADDDQRAKLAVELEIKEREQHLLALEFGELEKRKRAAYLAIYTQLEAEARAAYEQADEKSLKAHREAKAHDEVLRKAINGSIPQELNGDQFKIAVYLAGVKAENAQVWGLSTAHGQEAKRLKLLLERAQVSLAQAQAV